jgi:hypothetical protein
MRKDSCDGEAAGAFDVHEEGARSRDEGLFAKGVLDFEWETVMDGGGVP